MLRFALVGCGRIPQRDSELLGSHQITGEELIGVCDIVEAQARELGERFDVPFFTDMDEMVEVIEPDVISVLTASGERHVIRPASQLPERWFWTAYQWVTKPAFCRRRRGLSKR